MRDRLEVIARFQELRDRYLKERKDQYLRRIPINCVHNVRLRVKGKGQLGFCQNPLVLSKCGPQKLFLCNEDDTAQRCRVFCCKNTDATVEDEFKTILASPSRCGNDYPKLAMLIWFLQDDKSSPGKIRAKSRTERVLDQLRRLPFFRWL